MAWSGGVNTTLDADAVAPRIDGALHELLVARVLVTHERVAVPDNAIDVAVIGDVVHRRRREDFRRALDTLSGLVPTTTCMASCALRKPPTLSQHRSAEIGWRLGLTVALRG